MRSIQHYLLALATMMISASSFASATTITLGQNAIVNGNAEAGTGSLDGGVVPVPGWTASGGFTVNQYDIGGGYPASTDPGPADRGSNYFSGGSEAVSMGSQTSDVSNIAEQIDAGLASYVLSGYLGGFSSQDDNAVWSANFLGNGNSVLGSAAVGPVLAADRGNLTGFLYRSATGFIPAGTRSIGFSLLLTRTAGSANDGYADSLSFVAATPNVPLPPSVPEPQTVALMAAGLGVVLFWRRWSAV